MNLNNQPRLVLWARIYRRSHIDTGRKWGDSNRAGSTLTCNRKIWVDISAAEFSSENMGSQPHTGPSIAEHLNCKEAPKYHMAVKISRGSMSQEESARNSGAS